MKNQLQQQKKETLQEKNKRGTGSIDPILLVIYETTGNEVSQRYAHATTLDKKFKTT